MPENTQVQTRMLMDSDNRIADQSTNEPRNEPEFTDDEFKWHYAKLRLCKAPDTNGIPTERSAHGGERLHNQLLKLFNKCWMGKQNVPLPWVDATVILVYKRKGSHSVVSSYW